jgi:outer membrane receptor protein involved in Fe transport
MLAALAVSMCGAAPTTELKARIAPQPLSQALAAFADQTSLQLIYESALADGRHSNGAPAGLSVSAALTRILEGTGLQFEFLDAETVRLLPAAKAAAAKPQSIPEPRGGAQSVDQRLVEIVVTATKREEPLNKVPLSMYVLSAEAMDAAGVHDIEDIGMLVPGLQYGFSTQYGPGTYTDLSLSGILPANSRSNTVGIYVDDVPIHLRHTVFSYAFPLTFDLERVEVLRGPQGTLFGTGTAAGAIRFITREPSVTDVTGLTRLEVAQTDGGGTSFEAAAAGNAPLVEGLLGIRASAWFRRDGGYVDRVDPLTGATVEPDSNRKSSGALRVALALVPVEGLRITPALSYQSVDIHDTPSFYTYLSDPAAGVLQNGKLLRQPAFDRFGIASLELDADLGSAAALTSVTSYFDRTANETVDETNAAGVTYYGGFGNPLGPAYPTSYDQAVATQLGAHQIQLTQELRLASRNPEATLSWVAGLFYSHAREEGVRVTYAVVAPQDIGIYSDDYNVETEKAVFGEASIAISSRWRASLGARLGWTHANAVQREAGFANTGVAPYSQIVGPDEPALTPRFSIAYQADEFNLVYVSLAKGFQAGGVLSGGPPAQCHGVAVPNRVGSDSVWNYELGVKDLLFDRRLQLAATAFFIRWNGIQLSVVDPCGNPYTANAGTADSRGFDLTADAVLGHVLRMSLALGYVDAHYTNTVLAPDGHAIVTRGTVVGGLPSPPPPWSGTAMIEYDVPWGRRLTLYARALDVVHSHNPGPYSEEGDPRSSVYDPTLRADPATKLLSLQLGIVYSGLDVKLSASNVFNSHPTLQLDDDAAGSSLHYASTFRSRTLSLTATQRF